MYLALIQQVKQFLPPAAPRGKVMPPDFPACVEVLLRTLVVDNLDGVALLICPELESSPNLPTAEPTIRLSK